MSHVKPESKIRRVAQPLLAALPLILGVILVSPGGAAASTESPDAVAREAAAAGVKHTGFFVFEKNKKDPSNSRLSWQEWAMADDRAPKKVFELRWRAGSGTGSTDSCATDKGWLPNGKYSGTFMTGVDRDINGIVWQLENKHCRRNGKKGTERTALFIHSEMTPSGQQNPQIESERWDGPRDYISLGCIKLKPSDIKEAAERYRIFYGDSAKSEKQKLLLVI